MDRAELLKVSKAQGHLRDIDDIVIQAANRGTRAPPTVAELNAILGHLDAAREALARLRCN